MVDKRLSSNHAQVEIVRRPTVDDGDADAAAEDMQVSTIVDDLDNDELVLRVVDPAGADSDDEDDRGDITEYVVGPATDE